MFILSCCWQPPQHVRQSVYMNTGKEFICILSVCFCVRRHLFAPSSYQLRFYSTSQVALMLNLISFPTKLPLCSNWTPRHFLQVEVFALQFISYSKRYCLDLRRFSVTKTKAFKTQNRKAGVCFRQVKNSTLSGSLELGSGSIKVGETIGNNSGSPSLITTTEVPLSKKH